MIETVLYCKYRRKSSYFCNYVRICKNILFFKKNYGVVERYEVCNAISYTSFFRVDSNFLAIIAMEYVCAIL